jgi:hypothetical protein
MDELNSLPDVQNVLETARGSVYAQHSDGSTTGFREPSNMPGTGQEMQPRSAKTIYMDTKPAGALQSWISDEYIGTKLVPTLDEKNNLKGVEVHSTDDVSKRNITKGQVLSKLPATMTPTEGLHPVEIAKTGFESPIGSKGQDVHIGSKITKVRGSTGLGGGAGGIGGDPLHMFGTLYGMPTYKKGGSIDKPLEGNWKLI